jgi:glycerol 2-dehydrogenase (NADP+)
MTVYLMHWPLPMPASDTSFPTLPNGDRNILDDKEWSYIDTWKSMESLLKSGKCRAIGVSNMSIPFLKRLLENSSVVPAVNQVECHPFLPQHELLKFCNEQGILLQAYSPLGGTGSPLLSDPELKKIADAHGATVGQILISWQGLYRVNMLM